MALIPVVPLDLDSDRERLGFFLVLKLYRGIQLFIGYNGPICKTLNHTPSLRLTNLR